MVAFSDVLSAVGSHSRNPLL